MSVGARGKMLALEISPKVIRAIEFAAGTRPLKITRAAATDWPGGEPVRVGRFIRDFLSEGGFTARKAVVGYFGPLIEHRIYALPPSAGETREALVRGKVAEEISTPVSELRVTGEVVGKVVERGVERQEVLAVFTPEFEIRRLVFLLIEAGISPVRVTSVPLALSALNPEDKAGALAGFLHADPSRAVIGVADGGNLRFAREFPTEIPRGGGPAPDVPEYRVLDLGGGRPPETPALSEEEAAAERVVAELTRSLLYFRQLSRGGAIARIHWSGLQPSEAAKRLVGERLRIEIAPHPAAAAAELRSGISADPAEYAVPIGLALGADSPDRVNLLPPEYLARKTRWGNYAAAAAMVLAFLGANAGLYVGLRNAETRYRQVLSGPSAGAALSPSVREDFRRWMELRQVLRDASAGEKALSRTFTRWKDLFAALGAPVPKSMAFTSLDIVRTESGYRAALKGKARGATPVETQARVNGFLASVRKEGVVGDLGYAPLEVKPLAEGSKGYEQEFLLSFGLKEEE